MMSTDKTFFWKCYITLLYLCRSYIWLFCFCFFIIHCASCRFSIWSCIPMNKDENELIIVWSNYMSPCLPPCDFQKSHFQSSGNYYQPNYYQHRKIPLYWDTHFIIVLVYGIFILLNVPYFLYVSFVLKMTPLHYACRIGSQSIVGSLLENRAKVLLVDNNNFNCLDHAIDKGHE